MPLKRLVFSQPVEVTDPGDDSRSFLFPFSMVDAALVGAPEEAQRTIQHRLIVTVANNRLPAWHLTDPELVKVLFEIGRKRVENRVKSGELTPKERVVVHTESHPSICPFDPSRIHEPNGAVFEIEEMKTIGFR